MKDTPSEKKSGREWNNLLKTGIVDPDGWRSPGDPSYDTPITYDDFVQRMMRSSCIHSLSGDYIRYAMKLKQAMEPSERASPKSLDLHRPGAKDDSSKARPSLVVGSFARALAAVSDVGTMGALKYTDNGWRSVPNGFARYTDAMLRHYFAEQREYADHESGLAHAAHLAWNALARLELLLDQESKKSPG